MLEKVFYPSVLVADQDRALDFYTKVLGLEKRVENPTPDGPRFLTVGVDGDDFQLVLWPGTPGQAQPVMGRPPASITIETDDIRKTFEELRRSLAVPSSSRTCSSSPGATSRSSRTPTATGYRYERAGSRLTSSRALAARRGRPPPFDPPESAFYRNRVCGGNDRLVLRGGVRGRDRVCTDRLGVWRRRRRQPLHRPVQQRRERDAQLRGGLWQRPPTSAALPSPDSGRPSGWAHRRSGRRSASPSSGSASRASSCSGRTSTKAQEPGTWTALSGGMSEGGPEVLGPRVRKPVALGNPDGTIEAK